jgi:hypothetical protein
MDQRGLPCDKLPLPARAAASTATAAGRIGHRAGDPVHAHHADVLALHIDRHQRAKLRHELAELARVDRFTNRSNLCQADLGTRIDHPWIHAQAFALDDLYPFRRQNLRANLGDLAVLHQHRNALHLFAGYRVHVRVANEEGVVRGCRRKCRCGHHRHENTFQNSHCGLRPGAPFF